MPRILVVDDQKDVRAMIGMVLRVNQFDVVEAATPAAGLQCLSEMPVDAAIIDVFLDNANGLDLIAGLREQVPDLPVIAMSGMAGFDGTASSAGLAGVVYLHKPFRPAELLRALDAARAAAGKPGAGMAPRRASMA